MPQSISKQSFIFLPGRPMGCHLCTSDSDFKSALCNRNTHQGLLVQHTSAHQKFWRLNLHVVNCKVHRLSGPHLQLWSRNSKQVRVWEWQLIAKQFTCSGLALLVAATAVCGEDNSFCCNVFVWFYLYLLGNLCEPSSNASKGICASALCEAPLQRNKCTQPLQG